MLDNVRENASKVAYEIGAGVSQVARSFAQGVASRHEESIRAATEAADGALTEQREKGEERTTK